MKRLSTFALLALLLPAGAHAACYAQYKAKKDNPLRLHFGVMQLPGADCPGRRVAAQAVADRLSRTGWTLLNVTSLSKQPPSDQTRANAGDYYLRY
ncbi:MAG: hypothetical protein QNJ09_17145 [Paracoccaceae bacterium]|nr:hypothetical protein [Paracoccaceae bacterium]